MKNTTLHLNNQQLHRRNLILQGMKGFYTNKQLSRELMLSVRQIQKIKSQTKKIGDRAFLHGNTGRQPAITVSAETKEKILKIKEAQDIEGLKIFEKVNFTHFTELLEGHHKIKLSITTVTRILKEAGYKSPKKRRQKKEGNLHLMRPRRERFGELIQADGSEHDWFNSGKKYVIQGFIDDATGCPVGLYMTKHECLLGYIEATRHMLQNHGIPEQMYPDRYSVFFINKKEPTIEEQLTGKKPLTQFGRMMKELGVDMFPAYSPEAKGRIERFWQTIQSRLPIEFALRGIKTVEEANEFLPEFIKRYAKTFGVTAKDEKPAFVKMTDFSILSELLAVKIERKTDASGVLSLQNYKFMIPTCIRKKVVIVMSHHEGVYATTEDGRKHKMVLLESDRSNPHMPEVQKKLFEKFFLTNVKGRFKEFYLEAG